MAGRIISNEAFVSLATNNGYALGALVLGHSLRSVNTNRQLALMITQDVNPQVRQELLGIWDRVIVVDIIDSEDSANLALLQRPDLGITFTKLHAWKLVEYDKCVFLDADTLVLQNVDDLFNRPEISAAPDIGWPDCFNTGVFVFVPSLQTYDALVAHALAVGSFDGGDQGLLNSYFNDWLYLGPAHRLPFVYNLHSNTIYTYSPAFKRFGGDVKIVHFIGRKKPWQYSINLETGNVMFDQGVISVTSSERYIQQWWDVYNEIAAHRVTEGLQEGFHTIPLQIGSDSEDSETESGIHETLAERCRTHDAHYDADSSIAPALIPVSSCEINPLSTAPLQGDVDSDTEGLQEGFHSIPLQIGSDSEDSETENGIHETLAERCRTHEAHYEADSSIAPALIPVSSCEINPLSTAPLQSHEISQTTSGIGSLRLRSCSEESRDPVMTSSQGLSGRWRWEYGQVDYVGIDSFDNILRKLNESLMDL